jgi:hypothetical protein
MTNNEDKRVYPIKVRLVKPNPANQNKVVYNNIELYTYKDTVINTLEEFAKIIPMQKYLMIKSDVAESTTEVVEETNVDVVEDEVNEEIVEDNNDETTDENIEVIEDDEFVEGEEISTNSEE